MLIALVIKSMPDEYRGQIRDTIQACYPNDFLPSERGNVTLRATHFCYWNQYAESVCNFCHQHWVVPDSAQGIGAPQEVHPNRLFRSNQHGSVLPRPRMPFLSKAITMDGGALYSQIHASLEDVFEWLSAQVTSPLPFLLSKH